MDKIGAMIKLIRRFALAGLVAAVGLSSGQSKAQSPAKAAQEAAKPFINAGVEEFDRLRADKSAVVLDVRTPREYAGGRLPGALLIDWYASDFDKKVGELDKSKTYLVYCAVGGRSAEACTKMRKLGFASLYNLDGGFKAWAKADKPVEKN